MLPPILMLTTKKLAQFLTIFCVGFFFILGETGCAPAGARALIKGEKLVKEGKYSEAVKKFEEATKALPENAKAWNHLGLGYQYAGETKKAVQAYQQALSLDRNLATARYNLGILHLEQRNFAGAIAEFTTFTALEPKNADGWIKLGNSQLQLASLVSPTEKNRLLESAKKNFENAQKIEPSAEALNGLGMIQIQRGRSRDAAQTFAAALQQEPNFPPALLNLAVVYHQYLNEHRLALVNYRQFLKVEKNSSEAPQVQLAVRQLEAELNPTPTATPTISAPVASSKPPVQAERPAANPAPLKTQPDAPRANLTPKPVVSSPKAQLAPMKKEVSPQVVQVPEQIPIQPAQTVPSNNTPKSPATTSVQNKRAEQPVTTSVAPPRETKEPEKSHGVLSKLNPATWFKKNKIETTPLPAIKPTLEATESDPASGPSASAKSESTSRYHYRLPGRPAEGNHLEAQRFFAEGVKAQQEEHWSEAIAAYQKALKLDPSYYGAYYNLALAAREVGDLSAAASAYEYALAITPDSANARYSFAYTLQEMGYFQDAAIELRKLLALNPNETRAHLLLGNLYAQRLSQPIAAREEYLKVLATEPQHPQATQIRYWLAAHP